MYVFIVSQEKDYPPFTGPGVEEIASTLWELVPLPGISESGKRIPAHVQTTSQRHYHESPPLDADQT